MREIQFRAKSIKDNKWCYGTPVFLEKTYIFPSVIRINSPFPKREDDVFCFFEVDEETLCQYTGLKDKNGVEIYEGDIVTDEGNNGNAVIVYNESECQFVADFSDGYEPQILGEWCVIVGNIHDNPELLGESNE